MLVQLSRRWISSLLPKRIPHQFFPSFIPQQTIFTGSYKNLFPFFSGFLKKKTWKKSFPVFLGFTLLPIAVFLNKRRNTAFMLSEKNPDSPLDEMEEIKETLPTVVIKTQQKIQEEMQADQKDSNSTPVYRIVLTGGPCGGKSTAMATISQRLLSLGFRVFRVPEAATLVITGTGINPGLVSLRDDEKSVFEGSIIQAKISLEDIFYQIAKSGTVPSVIICDRGTMDTRAYMDQKDWEVLLDDFHWNVVDLRDKRYDAVIHMVTAAIGAEQFYTTENNAARSETLNEARALDFKVLNAWVGHPKIRIIDNSTDFKRKIQRVEEVICRIVGAPIPMAERRFIVSGEIPSDLGEKVGVQFETFFVEQTYLQKGSSTTGFNFIKRRGQNGNYTYTHSMVRIPEQGFKQGNPEIGDIAILERSISGREYIALMKNADPTRASVVKKVQCFLWNNVYYELQTFHKPDIGLNILKTETEPDKTINFPWFLSIKGEITSLKEFTSYHISERYASIANANPPVQLQWKDNLTMFQIYNAAKQSQREARKKKDAWEKKINE